MPDKNNSEDLSRKLQDVEDELKKIEKQSKSSSEDQFFFGISFSLLILFLTLPMSDAIVFLQNTFGLSVGLATSSAISIRIGGILLALMASLLRYYGSMFGEHACKKRRIQSIFTLLGGFWLFVFIIGENMSVGISVGTSWLTIPMGAFILGIFYALMIPLERRMLKFYVSKSLIYKVDAIPIVSSAFMILCFSFYFAGATIFFVSLVTPQFASLFGSIAFVSFFVLVMYLAVRSLTRKPRKKGQPKEKKTVQSLLQSQ